MEANEMSLKGDLWWKREETVSLNGASCKRLSAGLPGHTGKSDIHCEKPKLLEKKFLLHWFPARYLVG